MEKQRKEMVTLESYRQLESSCRLWMAACQVRDERIQQLDQECQALRQRVARLSRQIRRSTATPGVRKQVRFAR